MACAPVHFDKQRRAIQLSIGFCNLLWLGRLSLTDESACATLRLPKPWKLLACSQWWYWRWTRVKSGINIFDCTFVYGGFVDSDEGSVPLSANIFIFLHQLDVEIRIGEGQTGISWLRGGD